MTRIDPNINPVLRKSPRLMVSLGTLREQSLATLLDRLVPAKVLDRRPSVVFCACAFALICSLLLGGGTRGGFLSDAVLELLAVPTFLISVSSLMDLPWRGLHNEGRGHWVLAFCFAVAFLPLIQLVPLPPWIWTRLPGREAIEAVFDLLGRQRPWMSISVSPNSTWLSALSLLPPIAIFLGVIQLGYRERRGLSLIVVAVGVVSAFIGLTQVAQGPTSALRFFAITNGTEAVGFFANRNHFAALLYVVLLFTAAWAIDVAFKVGSWRDIRSFEPATIVALTAFFVVFIVLIASEAMARSRAGVILTIVALAGVFALASADRRNASGVTPRKLLLGATTLAIILAAQFALYRILGQFAIDPLADARIPFARNTIQAAKAFMPFGAGLGTFVPVYGMFEPPSDALANTYANHAHNDILELWLETGVMGMALLGLFVIWLGLRSVQLWWRPAAGARELDLSLMRAATVGIALLIAHSFVDYPLRTGAMMAILAFCCALLVEPLVAAEVAVNTAPGDGKGTAERKELRVSAGAAGSRGLEPRPSLEPRRSTNAPPNPVRQPRGRWGEDIDWPEVWRK
ncbi:MAG: O-antigen ligase family protein [Xanthobacteraceae bacterium]